MKEDSKTILCQRTCTRRKFIRLSSSVITYTCFGLPFIFPPKTNALSINDIEFAPDSDVVVIFDNLYNPEDSSFIKSIVLIVEKYEGNTLLIQGGVGSEQYIDYLNFSIPSQIDYVPFSTSELLKMLPGTEPSGLEGEVMFYSSAIFMNRSKNFVDSALIEEFFLKALRDDFFNSSGNANYVGLMYIVSLDMSINRLYFDAGYEGFNLNVGSWDFNRNQGDIMNIRNGLDFGLDYYRTNVVPLFEYNTGEQGSNDSDNDCYKECHDR